ncbi:uncharacterized protein [Antennarius striatus]|uniref:uncharacterized protein n=1 Tax=Antennarius striatus TaxID=241820 RepID=UPI0035B3E93B
MFSGIYKVSQKLPEAYHRGKQRCGFVSDFNRIALKQRTMESVRTAFHAQLAAVMDSLLAAAVCEIAKIFESSLCEQQVALAQKTEEISHLRNKMEKLDRRQKVKGGGGEEGEMPSGDRDTSGTGLDMKDDASSHPDPVEGISPSISGELKEEDTGGEVIGASVKLEHAVLPPALGSTTVQTSEGSPAAVAQRQIESLSAAQTKDKLSDWDQGSRSAENRPIQDQVSTPFLSISQSGRCSPRPDLSPAHPGEWLSGLDTNQQGRVSSLENLRTDGTGCSSTDTSCFQPGFGSDENSNEDDSGSFPFLDQEPENQNSSQKSDQGQGVLQRESEQFQPQAHPGEPPWRLRDDRGGRGPINHTRRVASFGNRDPLRPQSNSQPVMLRHANSLSHPAPPGGGNGRPYTCPYCTKCFTYPSHQRRHLLRHTGVRLHPCQFCDKSFLTPSELTVHTRTHTGERPFGCAQCGKRFARSGNLRAHQRDVHMGKRPFACTECGKRFAHRGNLRVHNHRVHQGDPYYMEDQQNPSIGSNPI